MLILGRITPSRRKCGNRPKRWVFSQTGLTGYVKAPATGSPSFTAGVLPQEKPDSRKFIPVPCTLTFAITCYTEIMKLNLSRAKEALRKLGLGLFAVGLLIGILKDDAILTAVGLTVASLVLVVVGNLERS